MEEEPEKVDLRQLEKIIARMPWDEGVHDNVSEAAARFYKHILEAFDRLAPCREIRVKKRGAIRPLVALQRLQANRDKAQKQYCKNYKSYNKLCNECAKMTKDEQIQETVGRLKRDDGNVWRTAKELTGSGKGERVQIKEGRSFLSDEDAAKTFNNYFLAKVEEDLNPLHPTRKRASKCDENVRKIASDKCNRTITRRTRGAHDKCMCSSRSERHAGMLRRINVIDVRKKEK
jgi:hypothetical protein